MGRSSRRGTIVAERRGTVDGGEEGLWEEFLPEDMEYDNEQ